MRQPLYWAACWQMDWTKYKQRRITLSMEIEKLHVRCRGAAIDDPMSEHIYWSRHHDFAEVLDLANRGMTSGGCGALAPGGVGGGLANDYGSIWSSDPAKRKVMHNRSSLPIHPFTHISDANHTATGPFETGQTVS